MPAGASTARDEGSPSRGLGATVALALLALGIALNGLTWRHVAHLREETDALVVARLVAMGGALREAGRGSERRTKGIEEWLASEEASGVLALRLIDPDGAVRRVWEHDRPARPGGEGEHLEPPLGRRPPCVTPLDTPKHALRGFLPFGPPGRSRGYGRPGGLLAIDLVPEAAFRLRGEGRLLQVGVGLATFLLWAGALAAWFGLVRQARLRRALAEEQRLADVGRMAGVLAHQIRNPLAAIKGSAQLELEAAVQGDPRRPRLERIVSESARLEALASRLLAAVRPMEPRPALLPWPPPLPVEAASPALLEVSPASQEIYADPLLLQEALVALVDNAREAGARRILLRLEAAPGGRQGLALSDDGPGIPGDMRALVVRPFVTTRAGGTGLGMTIATRIAEAHGGALEIGEATGGGARVVLWLPGPPSGASVAPAPSAAREEGA